MSDVRSSQARLEIILIWSVNKIITLPFKSEYYKVCKTNILYIQGNNRNKVC